IGPVERRAKLDLGVRPRVMTGQAPLAERSIGRLLGQRAPGGTNHKHRSKKPNPLRRAPHPTSPLLVAVTPSRRPDVPLGTRPRAEVRLFEWRLAPALSTAMGR